MTRNKSKKATKKNTARRSPAEGVTSSPQPEENSSAPKQKGQQGRRFTEAQRKHAVLLVVSGMKRTEVAEAIGTTTQSVRRWVAVAESEGSVPPPPAGAAQKSKAESEGKESGGTSGNTPRSIYAP